MRVIFDEPCLNIAVLVVLSGRLTGWKVVSFFG
ncbi:MAG: hypothetical protein ACI9US_001417, partial [Gammaproteobacteria bacterium]